MISFVMAGSFILKRLVGKKSTVWAESPLSPGPDSEVGGVRGRQTVSTEESLSEAEKNWKLGIFSSPANSEMFSLMNKLNELDQDLCEARRDWKRNMKERKLQQTEQHVWRKDDMKDASDNADSLKVSLAEARRNYDAVMQSNAQLENQNSDLASQVRTLQQSVQRLEQELSETHRTCNEMKRDCKQEQEAHSILKLENELQLGALVEAEKKFQKIGEIIVLLENEHIRLTKHFNQTVRLEELLTVTQTELAETQRKFIREIREEEWIKQQQIEYQNSLKIRKHKEIEEESEAHNALKEQYDKLRIEHEQEREGHTVLKSQYDQMKEQLEKLLSPKDALDEAEHKYEELKKQHEEVLQRISKLNSEHLDLICKFTSEKQSLQQQLTETQTELKVSKTQLKETQTELNETQTELERTETELELTQAELNDAQTELEETQSELAQAEKEMDATIKELQETQKELDVAQKELEETRSEPEEISAELEETRTELEEKRIELEESWTELEETQRELKETQSELEKVQTELERTQTRLEETQRRCIKEMSEKERIKQQKIDYEYIWKIMSKLTETAFEEGSLAHNGLKEQNTMMKQQYDKLLNDPSVEAEQKYQELKKQHTEALKRFTKLESEQNRLILKYDLLRKSASSLEPRPTETQTEPVDSRNQKSRDHEQVDDPEVNPS